MYGWICTFGRGKFYALGIIRGPKFWKFYPFVCRLIHIIYIELQSNSCGNSMGFFIMVMTGLTCTVLWAKCVGVICIPYGTDIRMGTNSVHFCHRYEVTDSVSLHGVWECRLFYPPIATGICVDIMFGWRVFIFEALLVIMLYGKCAVDDDDLFPQSEFLALTSSSCPMLNFGPVLLWIPSF